jgi:Ca-activated chloride channel family protein
MARAFVIVVFLLACGLIAAQQFGLFASKTATAGPGPTPTAAPVQTATPPPAADAVVVLVASSSAKKTWIEAAAAAYAKTQPTAAGHPVTLRLQHGNSGDQLREIQEGTLKPAIWSPGDDSWIAMANDWWRGQHGSELFGGATPLTQVPLCLAMWEPMAKALGHPAPIGWDDIAALAANPQGWAAKGHPEWGRFTWGHAHPDANSGFLTVVTMAYAAAGKTTGLTVDDLKNPAVQQKVRVLERTVEHYGLSNTFIDQLMRSRGPAYLSAAMQYENAVIEGNLTAKNQPFPLIAVYPKEGAVIATHPAAIPAAAWVDEAQRSAAQGFIAFLTSTEGRRLAVAAGVRPAGATGDLGEPFTADNGVAAALPAVPALAVPGDAILRRVKDLWLESKKPASVTLILDTSGSMNGEPLAKAKEGALGFLDAMYQGDEIEVISFSDTIVPLVPMGRVGEVRENARDRVRNLFARGGTHLHDVIVEALKRLAERRAANADRHYGIVVLTDGRDEGSKLPRADLIDALPKGDEQGATKVFTIGYGNDIDKALLTEIANRTSARMYQSSTKNVLSVYLEISANF